MDYEIQRCTRHCTTSGRELLPGEEFYSALVSDGADLKRLDYAAEEWSAAPDGAVGWWKSQMPEKTAKRMCWAPNDVMLRFLEELEQQPEKQDMRFVLALLLIRRRVLREEDREQDASGGEVLVLYCPRQEATYKVVVTQPNPSRADEIQKELAALLFANAT